MRRTRVAVTLGLAAVMVGAMACAAAPRDRPIRTSPIDTGPDSIQAARKYLEGRWSLLSFEVFPPGRQPIALKGAGSLVYDDYGNLRIEIRTDGPTAELLAAAGIPTDHGVISQDGRTVVDMQNRTLTYMIPGDPAVGAPSSPLATNRPRYWQVEGNILTLTTRDSNGKTLSVGRWQKAQ